MGAWKRFLMFCQEHKLNPDNRSTHEAFDRDQKGLPWKPRKIPEKTDNGELSWGEIEILTSGICGTYRTPCPYCGGGFNAFQIHKTLASVDWHCFYCGISGKSRHSNAEVDPDRQLEAEHQSVAERQWEAEKKAEKVADALRIWDQCTQINNTMGHTFFKARKLELPPNPDPVLRWHERCPFGKLGKVGCIVALFRNALTDAPTGIHRTYVSSAINGEAERMALGKMAGSAIKLWPLSRDSLAIGEGIETVLAAVQLGIAQSPAWATTVADNLTKIPVIPQVKRLTILADNDSKKSDTGEQAARKLRRTWIASNCEVEIKMPTECKDFNDLLMGRRS